MVTILKTDSTEAKAAIATGGNKNVLIHGSITYVLTGSDYKDPNLV